LVVQKSLQSHIQTIAQTDGSGQSLGNGSAARSKTALSFRAAFGGEVTRFGGYNGLHILICQLILIGIADASPDPRLLSLVPSGAQLVAGISASTIQDQPQNFVLMTPSNWVDLQDFFALTGADDTRSIHQIVFVEVANKDGRASEHSLLVSGRFDQPHIFKSAVQGGAAVKNFGGIPVLEIQPFARDRGTFKGVRWLAILDSNVLVFGSVASAQVELNRYLLRNHADESLLRRLARLRSKDQTWCLLSSSGQAVDTLTSAHEIHDVLAKLSPELAELAQSGSELEFGVRYGRRVDFEYEVTFAPAGGSRRGPASLRPPSVGPAKSESLLPTLDTPVDAKAVHGQISVSNSRYKEWLAQIKPARPRSD
jgi:hypothetical protein